MNVSFDRFMDTLHSLPIVPRRHVPSFGSQRSEVKQRMINLYQRIFVKSSKSGINVLILESATGGLLNR